MESDASQNFSAGRNIGHSADGRNTTARNSTSNDEDTTTTTNTSHIYNNAKHTQFRGSTINGPVNIHHSSQSSASTGIRTHAALENLGR